MSDRDTVVKPQLRFATKSANHIQYQRLPSIRSILDSQPYSGSSSLSLSGSQARGQFATQLSSLNSNSTSAASSYPNRSFDTTFEPNCSKRAGIIPQSKPSSMLHFSQGSSSRKPLYKIPPHFTAYSRPPHERHSNSYTEPCKSKSQRFAPYPIRPDAQDIGVHSKSLQNTVAVPHAKSTSLVRAPRHQAPPVVWHEYLPRIVPPDHSSDQARTSPASSTKANKPLKCYRDLVADLMIADGRSKLTAEEIYHIFSKLSPKNFPKDDESASGWKVNVPRENS